MCLICKQLHLVKAISSEDTRSILLFYWLEVRVDILFLKAWPYEGLSENVDLTKPIQVDELMG